MIRGTDFRKIAEHYKEKLCKIKVCAFDLDGVLTAGDLQYQGQEMQWNRTFHALDGYGFKILMKAGLKVGIITGGDSQSVIERFEKNLTVDFVYRGNEDKREGFKKILDMGYSPEEILYMGDEFFDLPLLKAAGFSVTTSIASLEIQESVDYVSERMPGNGCAREVIDLVRYAQGIVPEIPELEL